MFHAIPAAKTCAVAWVIAAQELISLGDEAYNVVVDIDDPIRHTPRDKAIIMGLDSFLRERRVYPIVTVANTIFPQDLYRRHGAKKFRAEYLRGYDSLKNKGWGRYFERMVRWQTDDEGNVTDQLSDLVKKLSQNLGGKQKYKSVYEMTLFDPARDRRRNRNRQCLSFLSFKLHPDRGLMLTAMYRNHSYIARALGNFIGLGNLMAYIAEQIGTTVGPLTCISTHAEMDSISAQPDRDGNGEACRGWTIREARELIAELAVASAIPVSAKQEITAAN
jgi:hypothetical protein